MLFRHKKIIYPSTSGATTPLSLKVLRSGIPHHTLVLRSGSSEDVADFLPYLGDAVLRSCKASTNGCATFFRLHTVNGEIFRETFRNVKFDGVSGVFLINIHVPEVFSVSGDSKRIQDVRRLIIVTNIHVFQFVVLKQIAKKACIAPVVLIVGAKYSF